MCTFTNAISYMYITTNIDCLALISGEEYSIQPCFRGQSVLVTARSMDFSRSILQLPPTIKVQTGHQYVVKTDVNLV